MTKAEENKLNAMMVRPTRPVREFLEAEVEAGNATSMSEAFNRSIERLARERDDVRRELVTAFGGRDSLLIGLLVARAVAAYEAGTGRRAIGTRASFDDCKSVIAQVLDVIKPPDPGNLELFPDLAGAQIAATITKQFARRWPDFPVRWLYEPSAEGGALLPLKQIVATWKQWHRVATMPDEETQEGSGKQETKTNDDTPERLPLIKRTPKT